MAKSTVEEIRARFDADVERFSVLEAGQSATIDAPLVLDLIARAAASVNPSATDLLDVGCGAGNYSLKLLSAIPNLNVTLVDLSRPMLDRAVERVAPHTCGRVTALQGDIRELALPPAAFDLIAAAAVLHHLRGDGEWRAVFGKFHTALKPGGSLWISDLVAHSPGVLPGAMWERYAEYLTALGGPEYSERVFAYIDKEDTPRPLPWQCELLRQCGFAQVEVLHKNGPFAAFCAIRESRYPQ